MNPSLEQIKTIVVVMMENRSFDHFLGYLSLPLFRWPKVDGIKTDSEWISKGPLGKVALLALQSISYRRNKPAQLLNLARVLLLASFQFFGVHVGLEFLQGFLCLARTI